MPDDSVEAASTENIMTKLFKWLHLKDEHPLLPLSIIKYVPVSVLLNFFGVVLLVAVGFNTLLDAYLTNVPLNSLIITIMITGVCMSVVGNIHLWSTGLYLSRLDAITLQFRVRDEEIESLQKGLKSRASILDCKNMQNLLDNLKNTGSLNVTDTDARMIKSKLGARIGRGRSRVSFLGGLLVMLGLLGTFLGLLGTIDSVGEAMAGMASIGSDSGEGDGMSGFIASLAAPLQGMGLAFSSSLFGLSGSLLVGTFQFFSNGAQDGFIESFSRWLDEQIPGMAQANKAAKRGSNSPPVADAELKAWIVGFIQTSQNTQRELADVVDAINISAAASARAIGNTESVLQQQGALIDNLSTLNVGVVAMVKHQERLDTVLNSEFTHSLLTTQQTIGQRMQAINDNLNNFVLSQNQVTDSLGELSTTLNDQIPRHVLQTSDRLGKALARINEKMARLSTQDQTHVVELAGQIKRLETLIVGSYRRSAQRGQRAQSDLQNQFRRESDILKKSIGENIASTVHKDVIPFIAKEQKELQKLAKLIDKEYGRRKDDKQDPDSNVA